MKAKTIREQVTDEIRDQVVTGSFIPGQALRETEFAEQLGVSRGPVRDAFLQLAQEGLLTYQPNRGVRVNSPPQDDQRSFVVSLRQQIECFVVKKGVKDLSAAALRELDDRLLDLEQACAEGEVAAVARCDIAFHESLLIACGGSEFLPVWKWLCSQMLMTYTRLDSYDQVFAEHHEILEAVRSGKKTRAVVALRENIL